MLQRNCEYADEGRGFIVIGLKLIDALQAIAS